MKNLKPQVIYEDDDVLVVDKPAGLIVHSDGRTEESSLADWVLRTHPYMGAVGESWTSPQGEVVLRPGIVHRLDRTTSGVLILAKTAEAFAFLKQQFQKRTVKKSYLAYVYGHPKEDGGAIEAEIRRTKTTPPRWTAEPGGSKKRAAITEWKVLKRGTDKETGEQVALLSVSPKTGRTHQIRVHLKALHHSVIGDALYAPKGKRLLGFERPALHAYRLSLTLPNGEMKLFQAVEPADFIEAGKRFSPN